MFRPEVSADGEYRERFHRWVDDPSGLIGHRVGGDQPDATVWSLTQGTVASPTVTAEPTAQPLPIEEESPVRACMQQTGQTRRECREDIRRSNGLP